MNLVCCYCDKPFKVKENNIGQRKKSIRLGLPIYCGRKCAGLGRRTNETKEEKQAIKSWYDMFLRVSMTEEERMLDSIKNALYFQMDYNANPEKYKAQRQKKMPKHVEYCRNPEYKKWKKSYDEKYRAQKDFGEFAEAAVILKKIDQIVDSKKIRIDKDCHNKRQKRQKIWKNSMQLT